MRALSLTQPWATLIATGQKSIETRNWATAYRGPLAIHAAKGYPAEAQRFTGILFGDGRLTERPPLGAVVAVAWLVSIRKTEDIVNEIDEQERLYGDYSPRRFAWVLDPDRLHKLAVPVPASGMQGVWEWEAPAEVMRA